MRTTGTIAPDLQVLGDSEPFRPDSALICNPQDLVEFPKEQCFPVSSPLTNKQYSVDPGNLLHMKVKLFRPEAGPRTIIEDTKPSPKGTNSLDLKNIQNDPCFGDFGPSDPKSQNSENSGDLLSGPSENTLKFFGPRQPDKSVTGTTNNTNGPSGPSTKNELAPQDPEIGGTQNPPKNTSISPKK